MSETMSALSALRRRPDARAEVAGSAAHPNVAGTVDFYQTRCGVLVAAEIRGLPETGEKCANNIFGFHVHAGGECSGSRSDPFANALGHYNPGNCPHPAHAGDLPPLFSNGGHALQAVLTDRFTVREIVGRTVIIHARRDDLTTQPSGDSGAMIACGRIRAVSCR